MGCLQREGFRCQVMQQNQVQHETAVLLTGSGSGRVAGSAAGFGGTGATIVRIALPGVQDVVSQFNQRLWLGALQTQHGQGPVDGAHLYLRERREREGLLHRGSEEGEFTLAPQEVFLFRSRGVR